MQIQSNRRNKRKETSAYSQKQSKQEVQLQEIIPNPEAAINT
jgi:hypothetical protein